MRLMMEELKLESIKIYLDMDRYTAVKFLQDKTGLGLVQANALMEKFIKES